MARFCCLLAMRKGDGAALQPSTLDCNLSRQLTVMCAVQQSSIIPWQQVMCSNADLLIHRVGMR